MKEIRLNRGMVVIVDDEDFERVNQFKWNAFQGYAIRSVRINNKNGTIRMHRFILDITDSKIKVDHKDCNGLNNQKSNLRFCTVSQNAMNQRAQIGKSSIYKGVYFNKGSQKYRAVIKFNQKIMHIGYYVDEVDAAMAYDKSAVKLFGEFARLNL